MRLRITQKGYHDKDGNPVEVGTFLTVDGDTVPASLLSKCEVVAEDTEGKEPLTNGEKADETGDGGTDGGEKADETKKPAAKKA